MRVVDTDVVVRYVVDDDPAQTARVERLLEHEVTLVPLTVLLETAWVLRSAYGFLAAEVVRARRACAGLQRVTLESPAVAAQAPDWAEQGLDLADALHLAAAQAHDGFVTFDLALIEAARRLGAPASREP